MYRLYRIQRRVIRLLYKLNVVSIVSVSDVMRSLGWLKFRYICIHKLLFIIHKAIHRGFLNHCNSFSIYFCFCFLLSNDAYNHHVIFKSIKYIIIIII